MRKKIFLQCILGCILGCTPFTYATEAFLEESFASLEGIEPKRGYELLYLRDFENVYEARKHFQVTEQRERGKIPYFIHIIWLGPKPFPIDSIENIRHWQKFHPNWTFFFWTDRERVLPLPHMRMRLLSGKDFPHLYREFLESTNYAEKSDILRYEILYRYGGIYIDHDADCMRPFNTLVREYDFFAALEVPHDPIDNLSLTLGIGVIGATSDHPLIKETIDLIKSRWAPITAEFISNDPHSLAERVTFRTYLPLTLAVLSHIASFPERDIILPAKYFYPSKRQGMGIYSTHYYGTSWNHFGEISPAQKHYRKIEGIFHKEASLLKIAIVFSSLVVGVLILLFFSYYRLKKRRVS